MKIENKKSSAAEQTAQIITEAARRGVIRCAVLSKPYDKEIKRAELQAKNIGGETMIQVETFRADNKALHRNIRLADALDELAPVIGGFGQVNVVTSCGECEYRRSRSGNEVVLSGDKLLRAMEQGGATPVTIEKNNREKNYILSGNEPFLIYLGVSSAGGRVHDKKQSKFRQINRFLELIRDVESYLPDDEIRICDLCCGKSYLSFAVYYYFAIIKGKRVSMTGVDLKPDVIKYCSETAAALGYDGLEFICGDVGKYETDSRPQLVISLHACDTATDTALGRAAKWGAKVILATPCCHHELNHKINCPELKFITDHSMLRQKLCDAATDALRLARLEAVGYKTAALELIDPDETPKNIMLRAIKSEKLDLAGKKARALAEECARIENFLFGGAKSDEKLGAGEK